MSVTIAAPMQSPSLWQRLTGTEPKTVIHEASTTTITNDPGASFHLKTAIRNGAIGAGLAGVLGGVSLLSKVALPVIGRVVSVPGLVRLVGVGGAVGAATAAVPLALSVARSNPTAKAATTGAVIGAAAGAVLPLLSIRSGAVLGAGVGLLVHHKRTHPDDYAQYPGYTAYPGYVPYTGYGMGMGVTPGMSPWGGVAPWGGVTPWGGSLGTPTPMPYPMNPAYASGYGILPSQAQARPQGMVGVQPGLVQPGMVQAPPQGAVATGTPAPAVGRPAPKFANARTFTDGAGNVRTVGRGTIVKPAAQPAGG